ncbi:MAG: ketopantoate reductase family protein [Clostridia bacterium]|nr:ketopantoate reductase family protein [Clostridia bacterium]
MKYAIYDASSMGVVLGAFIAYSGIDIELINRNEHTVNSMLSKGISVKGKANFSVKANAILPNEMDGEYSVIFLMTKHAYSDVVVKELKDFLSKDGVIVSLQKGVPEPAIADIIGPEHTMGCICDWNATLTAPGESTLLTDRESVSFKLGRMPGVPDEKVEEVKGLLEKMGPVTVEEDFIGVRWSKLLINATFSGLGTVMDGTYADVVNDKFAKKVALLAIKECIDVADAAGINIAPINGMDIKKTFSYTNSFKKSRALSAVPKLVSERLPHVPGMLQNLRAGKISGVESINGIVCKYGKDNNVPTPVNDKIFEIILKEQEGKLPYTKENILLFDTILMKD